jgi:hypothetical protein
MCTNVGFVHTRVSSQVSEEPACYVVGPHHFYEYYDTSNSAEEAKVRTECEALGYTWKYIPKHSRHRCVNEAATTLEECIDPTKFNHSKVSATLHGTTVTCGQPLTC